MPESDTLILRERGPSRPFKVHAILALLIAVDVVVTLSMASPRQGVVRWVEMLLALGLYALYTWRKVARRVVINLARQEVELSGRSLLMQEFTHHYPLDGFAAVRSFVHRSTSKRPWDNHLELVSRDGKRGLLLLRERARSEETENAVIARWRIEIATRTGLDDRGFVGRRDDMPSRVRRRPDPTKADEKGKADPT